MRAAKAGRRVDHNQGEIVKVLRSYGLSVHSTAGVGEGFADIIVAFGNQNWLFEIKQRGEKVNAEQEKFRRSWAGHYAVVETAEQVLRCVGWRV